MDTLIIDAVRTPRGRGKSTGSLATITPVELVCHPLRALKDRHHLAEDIVDEARARGEMAEAPRKIGERVARRVVT